jgi:hypothetical protein
MKIHARTRTTIMTIAMIMVVFIGEDSFEKMRNRQAYIIQT